MANTKNTKKQLATPAEEVVEKAPSVVKEAVRVPEETKKEFKDSDPILCRSVWAGGLSITCKSGGYYEFDGYGAECDIEYRDLLYLIRRNSDHVFTPRFVILDEDFLEQYPRIKNLYKNMYTTTELHEIISLPVPQMRAEIEKLPEATRSTLINLVATDIATGRLDSIKKVRALSEIFDSDFNLLSELFN